MPPILPRHARRVNFAAADLEALAVEQEIVFADGEGVFVRRVSRRSWSRDSHAEREKSHNDGNETI